MPSIFDYILGGQQAQTGGTPPFNPNAPAGGPTPSALDPFDPAEMRKAQLRDSLTGFGTALLAAGGPSTTPMDFGSALAKGLGGAAQGMNSGEDKYLKRALAGAQVQQARSKMANDKAWQDMFKSPATAATAAAPAPAASPASAAAPNGHQAVVGGLESNNNPQAVNPQSGAAGQFQFMPETWADVRAKNPDLNLPPDPRQAPAPLQAEAEKRFRAGNAQALQSAGIDPSPANLYVAHRAGAQGAQTLLKADPNAPMAAVVPANWIAQNPDMQGKTVGQFLQMAQSRFPGVAQGSDMPAGDGSGNPVQPVQYSPQGGAKTLPEVIQSLPPAVRQMMGAMPRETALPLLMKYADPETHTAIDTTTGQIVFAPKNDRSGRYQPVDAARIDLDRQRLEIDKRAAAAREKVAATGERNSLLIPGPDGQPTTNPALPAARGAVTKAESEAKVAPALMEEQGKLVIKDHQAAQAAAQSARSSTGNLDRLGSLLEQVNTNKFQGNTQQLKASAKALGVDLDAIGVGDNVGVAQAAQALSQQLALQLRDPSNGGGMPGAMSDADRAFLTQMVPSITNDPNANKMMIEWQKKINQRTVEVGRIVNDYVRSPEFLKDPAGVYAKVREYAAANPLFDPAKDMPKASPAAAAPGGMPSMNAIDAEIARRKAAGK